MKSKLFLTLALLAGVSYIAAQYNDDPTRDDQWGLDLGPDDNPYVDELGPDIHPGTRRMQNKGIQDTPGVDDPDIDDEWGWDQ